MNRTARIFAAALLGASCLLGAGTAAVAAEAIPLILKQRALVDGDGIHLSDLFANVPPESDGRIADSRLRGTGWCSVPGNFFTTQSRSG